MIKRLETKVTERRSLRALRVLIGSPSADCRGNTSHMGTRNIINGLFTSNDASID